MITINFIKFPKILLTDEKYSHLSLSAKVLYAFMLDRLSLSKKNGWKDEGGKVFIILTKAEAAKIIGTTERSVYQHFSQLEKQGLISSKKAKGKACIIYVNILQEWEQDSSEENSACYEKASMTDENYAAYYEKTADMPVQNFHTSHTEINQTEINQNKKSQSYPGFLDRNDDPLLLNILRKCELEIWQDGITDDIMEHAIRTLYHSNSIKVQGRTVYRDEILRSLELQTGDSIIYAKNVMDERGLDIRNEQKYLLSVLFNAPYDYAASEAFI